VTRDVKSREFLFLDTRNFFPVTWREFSTIDDDVTPF